MRGSRKIPPKLGSTRKPKAPPPLPPPVNENEEEPVYEYVTVAPFHSNVSHGVDLVKDKVVKVCLFVLIVSHFLVYF